MPALGLLKVHDLAGYKRTPHLPRIRISAYPASLHDYWRSLPPLPPEYLGQRASYPVRINGIAHQMASGPSQNTAPPWSATTQPIIDVNGLIMYHAHQFRLNWSVSLGTRTISIKCRHHHPAPPYPFVRIASQASAGIIEQIATAGPSMDTEQILILTISPSINAVAQISLQSNNTGETSTTTWGVITTT